MAGDNSSLASLWERIDCEFWWQIGTRVNWSFSTVAIGRSLHFNMTLRLWADSLRAPASTCQQQPIMTRDTIHTRLSLPLTGAILGGDKIDSSPSPSTLDSSSKSSLHWAPRYHPLRSSVCSLNVLDNVDIGCSGDHADNRRRFDDQSSTLTAPAASSDAEVGSARCLEVPPITATPPAAEGRLDAPSSADSFRLQYQTSPRVDPDDEVDVGACRDICWRGTMSWWSRWEVHAPRLWPGVTYRRLWYCMTSSADVT